MLSPHAFQKFNPLPADSFCSPFYLQRKLGAATTPQHRLEELGSICIELGQNVGYFSRKNVHQFIKALRCCRVLW